MRVSEERLIQYQQYEGIHVMRWSFKRLTDAQLSDYYDLGGYNRFKCYMGAWYGDSALSRAENKRNICIGYRETKRRLAEHDLRVEQALAKV